MLKLSPHLWFAIFCLSWMNVFLTLTQKVGLAQSVIVPVENPSQTIVTQEGSQINITGGTPSQQNLFHTFQQFNVGTPETVTFDTRNYPSIVNVLANVSGGNPSIINGQVNLIGSNANLFLINPTGILFGSNASLNLPGAFTATTASSIGFGETWWSGNTGDYSAFVSSPTGFRFSNSGSIVNAGNLTVQPGQNLALLGRNVINSGTLNAPGGEVLMMAVLDHQQVRLSSPGMILNLEIADISPSPDRGFAVLNLPTLLTAGEAALATKPTLTIAGDGTATIVNGEISTLNEVGGQIAILGDQVALLNARIDASGSLGGGRINIGGNERGQGNLPNSVTTLVDAQSEILADSPQQGNGGRVILWGENLTNFAGKISARGGLQGGDGGFVEVSGKKSLGFFGTVDVTAPQGKVGTLLLDPTNILITGLGGTSGDSDLSAQSGVITSGFLPSDGTDQLTLSETALETLLASANVSLAALNDITIETLPDGTLGNFSSSLASLTLNAGGTITMLSSGNSIAIGGNIDITGGTLFLGDLSSSTGNVNLVSTIGLVAVGNITASTGTVSINSTDQVQLNGTVTTLDDTLDPVTFPPEGFSNATGSISIITSIALAPPTDPTPPPIAEEPVVDEPAVEEPIAEEPFVDETTGDEIDQDLNTFEDADSVSSFNETDTDPAIEESGDVLTLEEGFGEEENIALEDEEFISNEEEVGSDEEETSSGDEEEATADEEFADVDFGPDDFDVEAEFDQAAYDETDAAFDDEFSQAFDLGNEDVEGAPQSLENAQVALKSLKSLAKIEPAIVYVNFTPSVIQSSQTGVTAEVERQPTDNLEIILVTSEGEPLRKVLRAVTRSQVEGVSNLLRRSVGTAEGLNSDRYLVPASRLYEWIIATIEPELQSQGINSILFSMPSGLRSLPLAALYDGKQFLVEKYSLGLTPSLRLTDLRYTPPQNLSLIALGSSEFTDQAPLPAVPLEVQTITQQIWPGDVLLNENFTLQNLLDSRESGKYGIIHLATHADFEANDLNQSYIQLWDSRLRFNQLRDLQFSQGAPVELLVLSACRTALGNDQAELGFAGLAVQAGVKTSLASLWYVSDEGTLGLMTEFYRQLRDPNIKTKSQALRQAQLAMIRGDIAVSSGALRGPSFRGGVPLPAGSENRQTPVLSHPYYWAAFTLVGSPW